MIFPLSPLTYLRIEVANLKSCLEKVNREKATLEHELESAEKESKTQNKILKQNEKKVYDLEKDNKKYKEDLKQVKEEFSVLKSQINKEKKDAERRNKKNQKKQFSKLIKEESNQDEFECKQCGDIFENKIQLRIHMVNFHTTNISTQTEVKISLDRKTQVKDDDLKEFEHYSCFYCAKIITSEEYLKKHIVVCHGMHQPKPLHLPPKL